MVLFGHFEMTILSSGKCFKSYILPLSHYADSVLSENACTSPNPESLCGDNFLYLGIRRLDKSRRQICEVAQPVQHH